MSEQRINSRVRMLVGDVRDMLATLPADSIDCVVTSPPYWGLRDNQVVGQIGLEPSLGEHLAVMVDVFRAVRRVLKPTGVCWINYGDCYAASVNGRSAADTKTIGNDDRTFRDKPFSTVGAVYNPNAASPRGYFTAADRQQRHDNGGRIIAGGFMKAKDMCLVPERLWIALQEDGWWVRSKFPWIKRNGMPERVQDRPANSLEQMAMLTKSARYWYDFESVRLPASLSTNARVAQNTAAQVGSARANGGTRANRPMRAVVRKPGVTPKSAPEDSNIRAKASFHETTTEVFNERNFRNTDLFFSSLDIGLIHNEDATPIGIVANPKGFKGAHFSTFPASLIEPLIVAGCPVGGTVLDPFGGSGTTAMVANKLDRNAIIIELNRSYAAIATKRILGGK